MRSVFAVCSNIHTASECTLSRGMSCNHVLSLVPSVRLRRLYLGARILWRIDHGAKLEGSVSSVPVRS